MIYGSIIDYLNYRLKLDGSHVWTDWLKEPARGVASAYPKIRC